MSDKKLCIHGHFYQPPREHPTTGFVPKEPGARPYRNWNEKIFAECYWPNSELGNFELISHDIGPTLARWIAAHDVQTYRNIIGQGRSGPAMAQAYNHTILPLASHRDKDTQVAWGVADFRHRYGTAPRGLWLPETAVDIDTLEVLADHAIEYTILAPWQTDSEDLDVKEPYRVALPSGRSIIVFFYEADLSGGVSFVDSMTENADDFVKRHLLPKYARRRSRPQLLTIASDGELYGHHKRGREHFLSYLLRNAAPEAGIEVITPVRWLDEVGVRKTTRIRENTSWSCHHGVDRWDSGCNCTEGDAAWKRRMRKSLDDLGSRLDGLYAAAVEHMGLHPWELRNKYIHVMLGETTASDLAQEVANRKLDADEIEKLHLLLRAQRMRQFMLTSCGWFFAGLGLEARNNLLYALEAVQLTGQATGVYLKTRRDLDPLEYTGAAAA